MKLWLLERLDNVGWDEITSVVVRARNEQEAQKVASQSRQWPNNHKEFTVKELLTAGPAEIIIENVNWG